MVYIESSSTVRGTQWDDDDDDDFVVFFCFFFPPPALGFFGFILFLKLS